MESAGEQLSSRTPDECYMANGITMEHHERAQGRPEDVLDVDELIRRLEIYRLELKLNQVRERSKALQNGPGATTLTYKPRYAVKALEAIQTPERSEWASRRQSKNFSVADDGTVSAPATDRKSRRTSRFFSFDKSSPDPSAASDPLDDQGRRLTRAFHSDTEVLVLSAKDKRSRRTTRIYEDAQVHEYFSQESPAPTLPPNIDEEQSQPMESPVIRDEKKARRTSRWLDSSAHDFQADSKTGFVNPKQILAARNMGMSESEAIAHVMQDQKRQSQEYRRSQDFKRQVHSQTYKVLESPAPLPKLGSDRASKRRSMMGPTEMSAFGAHRGNLQSIDDAGEKEDRSRKRTSLWLPPLKDRPNWAQASATDDADKLDRETFLARMNKRMSRNFAEPAGLKMPKPPGPPSRESADSAIDVGEQTVKTSKTDVVAPKKVGLRRSIANLFRRTKV